MHFVDQKPAKHLNIYMKYLLLFIHAFSEKFTLFFASVLNVLLLQGLYGKFFDQKKFNRCFVVCVSYLLDIQ